MVERVIAYEARAGQTLEVEDERLEGSERVELEPGTEQVRVTLSLDYRLTDRHLLTPLIDALYTSRLLAGALERTLERFSHELRADRER